MVNASLGIKCHYEQRSETLVGGGMTDDGESKGTKAKKHVVTRNQALELLLANIDYFSESGEHVDGKHRTEVIAKSMELDGQFDMAHALMRVHNSMKEVAKADIRTGLQWFAQSNVADDLAKTVKNTKYEDAVSPIVEKASRIGKILPDRDYDWEKSADVIAKVKRERFPDKLTMVEKLTNWQRDQTKKGPSKT